MVSPDICSSITAAFKGRERPQLVVRLNFPDTGEYSDALDFSNGGKGEITAADIKKYPDAIYGFTPDAFCFFLPKIFIAAISDDEPDLLVNNAIVNMLDRSELTSQWDTFFLDRWTKLSAPELAACQEWLLWLARYDTISPDSLSRSFDTLDILLKRSSNNQDGHP